MEYFELLISEFVKQVPKFVGSLILLAIGWLIGKRITHYWNYRKARQELDLESSKNFQSLYGEFFSVWKLWNYFNRKMGVDTFPEDFWWKVLDRASTAEGKLEALLVSLSCEKSLTQEEIKSLGMFRQGYQQLRESISDFKSLEWNTSRTPEYVMFKNLSPKVQAIIIRDSVTPPNQELAALQLKQITSNDWELAWEKLKIKN